MRVYLAGGMTGCSPEQMGGWRDDATEALEAVGFQVLSPLRGSLGFAGERAEFYRDMWDIKKSDIVLSNLADTPRVSIGTVMEMQCAWDHHKYVVAILDERHDHMFTREVTSYRADNLGQALAHIIESFKGI